MSPRFGDLDLPPDLDNALAEGRLVVFAGAGVSVSPPSSLPTFDGLTEEIGKGADPQLENEPFEVYLGRLVSGGVQVHEVASRILSDPASQPNALHRAIAGLWRSAGDVRIVTTNFDRHFEAVLRERWPESAPEQWAAPAFPVGSSFTGLVYLHGRLGRPGRLVLTDIDFGRAYLTEGWARRFLTALFQKYAVLFVGYSHKDTVLSYLARGLAPTREARRFALTDEDEPSRWRLLGVEPITYNPANYHAAVLESMQRWGELRSGGAIQHQERVTLLCTAPPISRQDGDYLLWCLDRPNLAQFFIRAARGVEWIEWLHAEGRLLSLLSASEIGEREIALLHWIAREMCGSEDAIERSLNLLASTQVTISDAFFRALANALWLRVDGSDDHQGEVDASTAKAILFLLPRRPANL
ncbi:MAG TPA: SIR2 family protein, partial [Thermoanaerobaculia bacterium]